MMFWSPYYFAVSSMCWWRRLEMAIVTLNLSHVPVCFPVLSMMWRHSPLVISLAVMRAASCSNFGSGIGDCGFLGIGRIGPDKADVFLSGLFEFRGAFLQERGDGFFHVAVHRLDD